MSHVSVRATLLACLALVLSTASVTAQPTLDTNSPVAVVLDGRFIGTATPAAAHCDDLIPGVLECFSRMSERDTVAELRMALSPTGVSSSGYVVAYQDASFLGASVVLSQDYSNLGSIGWNDRISSYKVYTPLTGYFYGDAGYTGGMTSFCCNSQVSYVGDARNDSFSSFDLP